MRLHKLLISGLFFISAQVQGGGIPVYSAVEHAQQLATHLEVLNDAMVQLEKLGVMDEQLATQINSLMTQYDQLNLQLKNAKALYGKYAYVDDEDILSILSDISSAWNEVERLDPTNPHFDEAAQQVVYEDYGDPTVRASDSMTGNTVALESMDARGQEIEEGYEKYLQYKKYRAGQHKLGEARKDQIKQYANKIEGLEDGSMQQAQQLTAYQINLMLAQQEELIARLDEENMRQETKMQEQRAKERQAYVERIETLKKKAATVYRLGD